MSTSKQLPVAPGDQIHFLESGFTFMTADNISSGIVALRGMTVTITDELIRASRDRHGDSWLSRLNDPTETRFAMGSFPSDLSVFKPGTNEFERERERRRQAAWAVADEGDRAKALKAVQAEFGAPASTQVSTEYRGSTALPVREQGEAMSGDHRTKTEKYRQLLALWFKAEHGISLTVAPYVERLSTVLSEDHESGHLRGLPDFLLHVRNAANFLPGEAVDEAARDAANGANPKTLSASIQFRKGRDLPDQLVFMNLATLAEIINRLEKVS